MERPKLVQDNSQLAKYPGLKVYRVHGATPRQWMASDGDYVIVNPQTAPETDSLVVVSDPRGTFFLDKVPENNPTGLVNCKGVVVAVMRKFEIPF